MGVIRAQNWDEFVDALQYFEAGKQNWLYADVEGNIGYVLPGKIPVRAGGDGSLPVPGWNDDYVWTGFIPYDELPKAFNPEKGFIATANNPQVLAAEYPYLISHSFDRGQRAQRVNDLILNHQAKFTIDDMVAIQTDNLSLSALEILPYLEDLPLEAEAAAGRDRLLAWDAQMRLSSPEAAYFNIFWAHLLAETFHDQLPEDHYPSGAHVTSDTIYFLLQSENDIWWDDLGTEGVGEDRDTILIQSLESAYAEGVETFGEDFDAWQWGELHTITYQNAVLGQAGISFIENLFNRGPYPTSGSESVIQKTCWSARTPYEVGCIPALRQVIDLGNLSNSRMVHNLGQSGHPMHPHYADFVDPWRLFEYHPSNWARFDIEAREHDVLVLQPAN
jgi:penicillin amidase